MKPHTPLARRRFLTASTAALTAPFIFPRMGWPATANSRLQHACIGVGGMMGGNDLANFLSHPKTDVIALCDVDRHYLAEAATKAPQARRYSDWRELLEKEGDRIDSVNVTIPDHMHAAVAMSAIRRKKHVYCQKPMCHDVTEVRALTEAAAQAGVCTQLGTQGASGFGDRMAVQFMRAGALGTVRRVVLCSNRLSGMAYRLHGPRPEKSETPPPGLDWDKWIGTAPMRPYAPEIYHPSKWRTWLDFGTGWLGDIGCHIFDCVWKGLGLTAAKRLTAEVEDDWRDDSRRRAECWPRQNHVTWIMAGTERTVDDLPLEWFDGDIKFPDADLMALWTDPRGYRVGGQFPEEAAIVVGTEGTLITQNVGSRCYLFPKDKFAGTALPKLEPRNHYHHFIDACLGLAKNESHFQQTGPMTETILAGTVALRVPGESLEWDAPALMFRNNNTANWLLRRTYRDGWSVPGLG